MFRLFGVILLSLSAMAGASEMINFARRDTVNYDNGSILWVRVPLKDSCAQFYRHNEVQLDLVTPAGKITLEDNSYTLLPLGDTTEIIINLFVPLNRLFAAAPNLADTVLDKNDPVKSIALIRKYWKSGRLFKKE